MILEISNIIILYFKPDSKLGNGVAVFNAWEESKKIPKLHEFIKYLVYWVAGSKLIFVTLLLVILAIGTPTVKILSLIVLILSISSFYWKLYPIIKGLDNEGHITPKGYSKSLGIMITGFILIFSLALLIYFII
ncbi:MAG: hypothetical protein ACRC57_02800 [Sarcina sp.]